MINIKSPLKRYGGKFYLLKTLLEYVPDHITYVEVFCGAAHFFFAKPLAQLSVLNDLDTNLITFFRVLQDKEKYDLLQHKITYSIYSRDLFHECLAGYQTETDPVKKAYQFYVVSNLSMFGTMKAFASSSTPVGSLPKHFINKKDRFDRVVEKIQDAVIENQDFSKIIKKHDNPNTLFYLDPPYVHGTRKSKDEYLHEMTNEQHEQLVDILLNIEGKYLVSGYENDIYKPLSNVVKIPQLLRTKTDNPEIKKREECLWMNYNMNEHLQPTLFDVVNERNS